MAEEITKVIENVDELFPEIVVNGESHVSERYVEPEPTPSQSLPQSSEEQTDTQPQQDIQGEYVDKLNLNGIEHDLKDSPLSAEVLALQELLSTIQSRLNELNALIPSTATAQNQLADKNFVNSSIATNTANFLGTYTSLADIEAIQNPTNNDYAFLETADGAGNNVYDRYKYSAEDGEWLFEYELNNSSFTAEQWATINSGISQVSDTVQDGDTNPVSSDAVYEALQNVAGAVDVVEDDNMNAVTSNAVYNFKPANATHADTATSANSATSATSATTAGSATTATTARNARNTIAWCTTASATSAKTATLEGYALTSGDRIPLYITTTNTSATALTLNVNSTGAKTIRINGSLVTSATRYNLPAGLYIAHYDGTYWNLYNLVNVSGGTSFNGSDSAITLNASYGAIGVKAWYISDTSGYVVFVNGLKIQWGVANKTGTSGTDRTITKSFNIAFTQPPCFTFAPYFANNNGNYWFPDVTSLSASSFTVNTRQAIDNVPIRWIAIGR